MIRIIIILILIQYLIQIGLTIECLDYVLSRSDTSRIESVNDKKCFANYCTYVSNEFLTIRDNKTVWVPSRYARECTNQPTITIGSIHVDSLNVCQLIYDTNEQIRYFVKICNSNLCNEQCEVTSNQNNNNNNNNSNNINIYIEPNCCSNKLSNCCQTLPVKPACCHKELPHWPPLGPQLSNQPTPPLDVNNKVYLANLKCCNLNNPTCCNIRDATNTCCMMMLQMDKKASIFTGTNDLTNTAFLNKNRITETYDTLMINNICCKNYKPNCCNNVINEIPCCKDYINVLHPGPVIENNLHNRPVNFQKLEQSNIPIPTLPTNKDVINNPFSSCCSEEDPFCCIPVESANSCCLKILYKKPQVTNPASKSIKLYNDKNLSSSKFVSVYTIIFCFISFFLFL